MAEYGYDPGAGAGTRVLRQVAPWAVLAVLLVAALIMVTGFRNSLRTAVPTASGSTVATPSAETSVTAVATNTVAVTRVTGVTVVSAASTGGKVLLTLRKGAKVDVFERTDDWLHVKTEDGLIGWVANSAKNVAIRKK